MIRYHEKDCTCAVDESKICPVHDRLCEEIVNDKKCGGVIVRDNLCQACWIDADHLAMFGDEKN